LRSIPKAGVELPAADAAAHFRIFRLGLSVADATLPYWLFVGFVLRHGFS